jgi:hypothetical protein
VLFEPVEQSLFDLLYKTLSVSFIGTSPARSFFVMNLRSQFVDPDADYGDPEVQLAWAQTLNAVTCPSPFFVPGGRTVWTELDQVFEDQQFPLDLPQPSLAKWEQMKEAFAAARVELNDGRWFEQTSTVPDISSAGTAPGWTRLSFSPDQPTGVFSLELEVLRLKIIRTWLDGMMFRYRDWRWTPGTPEAGKLISDGRPPTQDTLPDGSMPFLPTTLILARNVDLRYSIGSPTGGTSSRPAIAPKESGSPILVLGWITEVLPLSPDPNPDFEWPPG